MILAALKLFFVTHGFDVYAEMVGGVAIPFMMFAVWCVMPARRLPSWLDNMFFPIYLMHMCFIWLLKPVFRHVAFFSDSPRMCAILNLLFGVFGSILVAHLLRRLFPRLARLVFGDR